MHKCCSLAGTSLECSDLVLIVSAGAIALWRAPNISDTDADLSCMSVCSAFLPLGRQLAKLWDDARGLCETCAVCDTVHWLATADERLEYQLW